jgi:hypothetical protein
MILTPSYLASFPRQLAGQRQDGTYTTIIPGPNNAAQLNVSKLYRARISNRRWHVKRDSSTQ